MNIPKKTKSYCNCLPGLNSRIFLLLNADYLLSITMPQYNSSLFTFSYSMPFIRFSPDLCPIGTDSLPIHLRTARPRIKCIYPIS